MAKKSKKNTTTITIAGTVHTIVTHSLGKSMAGNQWFSVSVNGQDLRGRKGSISRFSSREEAASEAVRRLQPSQGDRLNKPRRASKEPPPREARDHRQKAPWPELQAVAIKMKQRLGLAPSEEIEHQ